MLATMRPIQHLQSHIGDSRSTSRTSNYSNNSQQSINRATPDKQLSRSNSGASNSGRTKKVPSSTAAASSSSTLRSKTKKPATTHSSLSNEVEAIEMTKPGLITLSKPLSSGSGSNSSKKAFAGGEVGKAIRPPRKKKGPTLLEDVKASEDVLSRSAPAASKGILGEWDMPGSRADGAANSEALNWQQELLAFTPEKKGKTGKKVVGNKNAAASQNSMAASAKESLNWQQELLGSNKPRGPTFDVFADAKDVATFGGAGDERGKEGKSKKQQQQQGGGRKRAESVGERAKQLPNKPTGQPLPTYEFVSSYQSVPILKAESGIPITPNGKLAYAGPNFHNSPSPASLPVPKFLQQRGNGTDVPKSPSTLFAKEAMMNSSAAANGSGMSNDCDTTNSSEEWQEEDEKRRSIRGATAPPEMQTQDKRFGGGKTIEDLLANLLRSE